jgi:hypothetical protein
MTIVVFMAMIIVEGIIEEVIAYHHKKKARCK